MKTIIRKSHLIIVIPAKAGSQSVIIDSCLRRNDNRLLLYSLFNNLKLAIGLLIFLFSVNTIAQEKLSLKDCYTLINKNYPLAKQTTLLENKNAVDLEVIKTQKLPQITAAAQATYQSDVIQLPISIPGFSLDPVNKDQYKATVSLNQLIYSGGLIKATSEAKKAQLQTKLKQVEVSLYQLKKQVNQLYFSILLQHEKRSLLTSKKELLEVKLKEVNAGIKFGALLPSSNSVLEAEILKIEQQFEEIDHTKKSLLETLSQLIGAEINNNIILENVELINEISDKIKRPELELFQLKKAEIESNQFLISKQNSPKIVSIASGGYGNPGLNMLDNSFQEFYTVGLKINWTIFDWNANKKQRKSLAINKDIIDNEECIFKLNTTIELNQEQTEIAKISSFIKMDTTIINLRKTILKTAESQLKNGVITSSAYITEFTNLLEAENNLATHKIQLLLAKTNYNTIKGN